MNPHAVPEWKAYIEGLSGPILVSKARAANSLAFVQILQSEGFPPGDISSIFLLWARRLEADNQAPAEGFQGEYLSFSDLLEQGRAAQAAVGRTSSEDKSADLGFFRSLFETSDQLQARLFANEIELTKQFGDKLRALLGGTLVGDLRALHEQVEEGTPAPRDELKRLINQLLSGVKDLADSLLRKFSPDAKRRLSLHQEGPPRGILDTLERIEKVAPAVEAGRLGIPLLLRFLEPA